MAGLNNRKRARLVLDQNNKCFYCHLRMDADVTLEHLKAKKRGGGDNIGNLRAAHMKCNGLVGHLPVDEKLRLHHIGKEEGSDAFFVEINRLNEVQRRKKKKNKSEKKRRRAINQVEMGYEHCRDGRWQVPGSLRPGNAL